MKTQVTPKTTTGIVKTMRQIRDEISNEIKDMSFEEERAYLNKLLAPKTQNQRPTSPSKNKGEENIPDEFNPHV